MTEALSPPTLPQIERAIDEVVSALVDWRNGGSPGAERPLSSSERVESGASLQELIGTERKVLRARDLTYAPVEHGLKHSLRELGEQLFELVGDAGMIDVAERVCSLDENNWERRMSPINSAWNGIGSWLA